MSKESHGGTSDTEEPGYLVRVADLAQPVCPEWCTVSAERHIADLRDNEGALVHDSESLTLHPSADPRWALRVNLGSVTTFDGTDINAVEVLFSTGEGASAEEVEQFAHGLLELAARSRSATVTV